MFDLKRKPYFLTESAPLIAILPAKRARLESKSPLLMAGFCGMGAVCWALVDTGINTSPKPSNPEMYEHQLYFCHSQIYDMTCILSSNHDTITSSLPVLSSTIDPPTKCTTCQNKMFTI